MDLEKLRRAYARKLRRAQAIALVKECGFTAYTFRVLLQAGQIKPQNITGKQARFDREQILTLLS